MNYFPAQNLLQISLIFSQLHDVCQVEKELHFEERLKIFPAFFS
jgi:hypothetical protein